MAAIPGGAGGHRFRHIGGLHLPRQPPHVGVFVVGVLGLDVTLRGVFRGIACIRCRPRYAGH